MTALKAAIQTLFQLAAQESLVAGQRLEPDEVEGEGQLVERRALKAIATITSDRQIEEDEDHRKIGMAEPAHQTLPN